MRTKPTYCCNRWRRATHNLCRGGGCLHTTFCAGHLRFHPKRHSDTQPNLPERAQNILYADKGAGYAFAARVFLQMDNYGDALDNAQLALQRNAKFFDWTQFYNNNIGILGKPDLYQNVPSPLGYDFVENYNFCHDATINLARTSCCSRDKAV